MTIDLSDLLQDGVLQARRRIRRILKFCFRRFVGSAAFAAFIGLFASAALADSPATAGIAAGGIENLCARLSFEETSYIVCTVPRDLKAKEGNLRLFWKDRSGQPYRRFSALSDALAAKGETLAFAMNAGMYSDEFVPVGLYVENGHEGVPLNTRGRPPGKGPIPNFYRTPNGVFFADGTGAHIVTTEAYLKRLKAGKPVPLFATQSGPMLVIGNHLHPDFIPGSTDRTRRSGVGVCSDGTIRFAVSEDEVNFHDFARLFRDELKCPDALFLDGGHGTGLYAPALGRNDTSWHGGYGPIFALVGGSDSR